jgi:hypothetical protein
VQPKILVIGSKDHDRADCVDWLQPFPNIEEYDSIIINLQSLTQETYDKIQRKMCEMKESINIVFDTNREIFCIMNKLIEPSPPPSRPGEPRFKLGYFLFLMLYVKSKKTSQMFFHVTKSMRRNT